MDPLPTGIIGDLAKMISLVGTHYFYSSVTSARVIAKNSVPIRILNFFLELVRITYFQRQL